MHVLSDLSSVFDMKVVDFNKKESKSLNFTGPKIPRDCVYKKEEKMDRKIPVLFKEKKECCGCTACYAICSQMAISMIEDEEGFEYPRIDETKCVKCYQCLRVCPFKEIQ